MIRRYKKDPWPIRAGSVEPRLSQEVKEKESRSELLNEVYQEVEFLKKRLDEAEAFVKEKNTQIEEYTKLLDRNGQQ